jgi:cytoskeletal protein RodZ
MKDITMRFEHNAMLDAKMMLLAAVLASGICVLQAVAQSPAQNPSAPSAQSADAAQSPTAARQPAAPATQYHLSNRLPMRAQMYYQSLWGVDSFKVKYAESGEMIRFSYRVLDPDKATALNDKKAEPSLIDPQAGVSLVVPQLPNVGMLRQRSAPKAGMTYWMGFSNAGRRVRPGHRVNVVIGQFHASNLVVE